MSTSTNQPRTPAGSPQGGQFATNPGGGEGPHLTGDLEFGPNTAAVQAILDRAAQLTPDEVEKIGVALDSDGDVMYAVEYAVWESIRDTARYTAWRATLREAWNAASGPPRGAVTCAALAEVTRDLISQDHYNLLMAPWRAAVRDNQ